MRTNSRARRKVVPRADLQFQQQMLERRAAGRYLRQHDIDLLAKVFQPAAWSRGETSFVQQTWIDRTRAIGDAVRLRITGPCGRCVMTTLAQGILPKERGVLRTAVQHNQGHVGVYATVLRGGKINRGDHLRMSEWR